MTRDQFLYSDNAKHAQRLLDGMTFGSDYVADGIVSHTRAVLAYLESCRVCQDAILNVLRERYLWHYAERVAQAMANYHSKQDGNLPALAALILAFPMRGSPAFPCDFRRPKDKDEAEEWDELFDDVPGMCLPDISPSRPERIIDWQLWFDRYQYEGTPFELLARPWDTTREHYALMVSSLPIGNIHHLRVPYLSEPERCHAPQTVEAWNEWLDQFYEHLAPFRPLDSVPLKDRTLAVCERYRSDLKAHEVPTEVLWTLAERYPDDARFVNLGRVVVGDAAFVELLRSEPGYFTTVLGRMSDPMLITKLAYMACPSKTSERHVVTLEQVPEPFRSPGICEAYYRASSRNLEFIPLALRQGHWEL